MISLRDLCTGLAPVHFFLRVGSVAAAVLSCVLIAWLLTSINFEKEGISLAIWLGIGFLIYLTNSNINNVSFKFLKEWILVFRHAH